MRNTTSNYRRWRFFVWDTEGAFYPDYITYNVFDSKLAGGNCANANSQNFIRWLWGALSVHPFFKVRLQDRLALHLGANGSLLVPVMRSIWEGIHPAVSAARLALTNRVRLDSSH